MVGEALQRRYAWKRYLFSSGEYDATTIFGVGLPGHELVHVGQYRNGMNIFDYLWASRNGYNNNPYEIDAYLREAQIENGLINNSDGRCECLQ